MSGVVWSSIACRFCGAQAGERCFDPEVRIHDFDRPVYLPNPHAERIEDAVFVTSVNDPQDSAPITDAEILATGLI